jgi:uncharacterized membrane protein YdjX (TVP38/TMEM64 family)
MKAKFWIGFIVLLLVLAGFAFFLPWRSFMGDPETLVSWMRNWGRWAPLVTIGLHILQVITAPIPGTALDAVNGLLFGPWLGTLYSMIGLISGSWLAMLLARRFGRPLVERFVDAALIARLDGLVKQYGSVFIFLIFLIPFLPDDAICFLAGLTPIPILELVILAMLGRLPGVFFANLLGSRVTTLAAWQWVLLAGLFALILALFWRKRKELPQSLLGWVEKTSQDVRRLFRRQRK